MNAGTWMVIAFAAFVVAVIVYATLKVSARSDEQYDFWGGNETWGGMPLILDERVPKDEVVILEPGFRLAEEMHRHLGTTAAKSLASILALKRAMVSQQTFPGVDEVSFDFPVFVPRSRPYDWRIDT